MSEQAAEFDSEFIKRISDPNNYISDNGSLRPSPITGYMFKDWDYPALHTTLFWGRFAGEETDLLLPWTTRQDQYDGDTRFRLTRSTHKLHIKEMELKAVKAGFKPEEKTIFGYLRPATTDDYSESVFNTKDHSAIYDVPDRQLLADLTERMPKLTLALGKILVRNGEISQTY